jgi:predicted dehydrogenase
MPAIATIQTLVCGQADQEQLIRDAAKAASLSIVAAASIEAAGAADLAKALGAERVDDIRQAAHREGLDLIWLADPRPVESDTLRRVRDAGIRTITSEPQFGLISDLQADTSRTGWPTFVPAMRRSPGFRAAVEALPQFGQAQCVNVFFRSGPGQGSLFARLFDAMDVITSLCDQTQAINAALAGPLNTVPEHPEGLHGHMTVNMRFKSNRCACAALSDSAGSWFRGVTVLGEGGCLRISDGGFDWIGPAGNTIDSLHSHTSLPPGELVGMQIARALEDKDAGEPPPDIAGLLSLCEAARLSCLTGQDESPGKLMEMMSRP